MAFDGTTLEVGRFDYGRQVVTDDDIKTVDLEPGEGEACVMVQCTDGMPAVLIASPHVVRLALIGDSGEVQSDDEAKVVTAEARSPEGVPLMVGRVAYNGSGFDHNWKPASFHMSI